MITEDRARELAFQAFDKSGRIPADYDVTIETGDAGAKWWVWFDRKGPFRVPGGKHLVKVDKASGEAIFMQGE